MLSHFFFYLFLSRPPFSLPVQHFKVCKEAGIWQQTGASSGSLSATSIPRIPLLDVQPSVGVFLLPIGGQHASAFIIQEPSSNPTGGAVFPAVLFPVSSQQGHEDPHSSGQVHYSPIGLFDDECVCVWVWRNNLCFSLSDSVSVYLGYDIETLRSRSWYSLIHPRDLSHASAQHCALCEYLFIYLS